VVRREQRRRCGGILILIGKFASWVGPAPAVFATTEPHPPSSSFAPDLDRLQALTAPIHRCDDPNVGIYTWVAGEVRSLYRLKRNDCVLVDNMWLQSGHREETSEPHVVSVASDLVGRKVLW
jgi:hypothetical protein